jgi:hypothetical protein
MTERQYDVFLAHNSLDKPLVRIISEELKHFGITSWLDEERILPGECFQDSIQRAINQVKSAAICIGRAGLGKWQSIELRSFVSRCIEQNIPVIPVLLPGVRKVPDSNLFLKEFNWVSFADGIDNERSFALLVQGINQNTDSIISHRPNSSSFDNYSRSELDTNELHSEKEFLRNSQRSKEFISRQLSEHINDSKEHLESLETQKESVERKLEGIKQRILTIESILSQKKDQSLTSALKWLKNEKFRLARSAREHISGNEVSAKGIAEATGGHKKFDWVLEKFVEIIDYHLLTNDKNFLELIDRLSISSCHIEPLLKGLHYMKKRIDRQGFSCEIQTKTNFAIDEIVKYLCTLSEDEV